MLNTDRHFYEIHAKICSLLKADLLSNPRVIVWDFFESYLLESCSELN